MYEKLYIYISQLMSDYILLVMNNTTNKVEIFISHDQDIIKLNFLKLIIKHQKTKAFYCH